MTKIRLNVPEDMDDIELEEALLKALTAVQKPFSEPNREFPDRLANAIKDEANRNFDLVINNMLEEIQAVINKQNK